MNAEWVKLNVGGTVYQTTRTTLLKDENSMIYKMFSQDDQFMKPGKLDENGCFLIDRWFSWIFFNLSWGWLDRLVFRNGRYFEPILNYLRTGQILYEQNLNVHAILEEAKFFGIQELIDGLQQIADTTCNKSDDTAPLTRQDVIRAITKTSFKSELRFQVSVVQIVLDNADT